MPNLVLEYSNSVDERVNVQGLLEDLHKVTLDSGLFELASVKSRALRCHNWLVGEEGDSVDFIHINFDLYGKIINTVNTHKVTHKLK